MENTDLVVKATEAAVNFDYKQEDMGAYYDSFDPAVYDEMLVQINYKDHTEIVKAVSELEPFSADNCDRSTIAIMDIGAGTGRCGEELMKHGFKTIDAVDPSKDFLVECTKRGYRSTHHMYLGQGDFPKADMKEAYGLVVSAGVWVQGHIPCEGLMEVYNCLKNGGFWVLGIRSSHLVEETDTMGYAKVFNELLASGMVKEYRRYTFMRGNKASEGDKNPLFKEQESTLLILQKKD